MKISEYFYAHASKNGHLKKKRRNNLIVIERGFVGIPHRTLLRGADPTSPSTARVKK